VLCFIVTLHVTVIRFVSVIVPLDLKMSLEESYNNNNNVDICIAPYGRNFRGAVTQLLVVSIIKTSPLFGLP